MHYFSVVVLSLISILFPLLSGVSEHLTDKKILLVNSYDPSFPTYKRRVPGVASVFEGTGAVLDIEYMDSKRHFDEESQRLFLMLFKKKIADRPKYDVVITSDDNALTMLLQYRNELFPDIPIVFTGLNDERLANELASRSDITGVVESVSAAASLKLIGSMNPVRKRLNIIVDGTPSGQADLARVLKAAEKLKKPELALIDLSRLTWKEYEQKLALLGNDDSILLLSAFKDKTGKAVLFQETLSLIKRHAQVPIYHLWEHGLGDGILGGILINQFEQGREAALMAKRIVTGTPISNIPVMFESTNQPMFDYQQLQRFNIKIDQLPLDAKIFFKPESLWQNYRLELTAILIVFVVLIFTALYLARETLLRTRLAEESSKQNRFLRSLMNTLPDLIWLKDPKGYFLACNRRFEELYGAPEVEIVGKTDFDFVSPEVAQAFRSHDQHTIDRDDATRTEERVVFKSDGHEELIETIKTPLKQDNGILMGVLGISRDITDRVAAEEKIKKLLQAVEQSPVSVMICNRDGLVDYVNTSFEELSGYDRLEILGRRPRFLQLGELPKETYDSMWLALGAKQSWEGEFKNFKKNGELFYEYIHMSPILNELEELTGYLIIREDMTVRREQEEKIRFHAHFDALTHLPNRLLSQDRLQLMLKNAHRQKQKVGVFYIDLDDFKKINDALGHEAGDQLLVQVAERLSEHVREGDTIGRLGGDEFIVLLNSISDMASAGIAAMHLIRELQKPFVVGKRQLLISASIGVVGYPDDATEAGELMRKADLAMYTAKKEGGSCYAFYTAELNEKLERRFLVEQQLRGALKDREFFLVYQPKVNLATGELTGFEVLIRWSNPVLGAVSPIEFVPIAEQTGDITDIGYFIVEESFAFLSQLINEDYQGLTLSINLSPRQFRDQSLAVNIFSLLKRYKLKPEQIEFEITEGLLIDDFPGVSKTLLQLHQTGIQLAMDDFGTGYSSLSYLRRYPFDTLKVDREFVQGITENRADAELVNAAISMAHGLGLIVVAEGVETDAQKDLLMTLGCDIAQGYLYSKPLVKDEALEFIRSGCSDGVVKAKKA